MDSNRSMSTILGNYSDYSDATLYDSSSVVHLQNSGKAYESLLQHLDAVATKQNLTYEEYSRLHEQFIR